MNGKDFIAILDYMKTFDKPAKQPKRWRKEKETSGAKAIISRIQDLEQERELLQKYLKEQEKINKKDEKKDDKSQAMRTLTFAEGMIMAYLAQFIIGPLYSHYIATLTAVH